MKINTKSEENRLKKLVTGILLFSFIIIGYVDVQMNHQTTYSMIMSLDINRVFFYTFFMLVIGCWLLYNKWLSGIGFISLAAFNNYFPEYVLVHNYFASVIIYVVIVLDIIIRKKYKWLIPLAAAGVIQGLAFIFMWFNNHMVGVMELTGFCLGSIFIVKNFE